MNSPAQTTPLNAGRRKYSSIWNRVKNAPFKCDITTTHADSLTIINGVKKEKSRDRTKPKDKMLAISTVEIPSTEVGAPSTIRITFKLVDEVSINTI